MRKTKIITITAGTPIPVHTDHVLCTNIIVQTKVGTSAGICYLILGVKVGETPHAANGIDLVAAPTVPTAPFVYTIPDRFSGERIDLSETFIDGAHDGDKVLVSWWEIPA